MRRVWFILIKDKKEGPYSVDDLVRHPLVEFDTLVWKKGFQTWQPLYTVKELAAVLEAKKKPNKPKIDEPKKIEKLDEVLVQTNRFYPPPILWWIFIVSVVLAYFLIKWLSR